VATSTTTATDTASDAHALPAAPAVLASRGVQARREWALVRFAVDSVMLALGAVVAETGWRAAGFEPTPAVWFLVFPVLTIVLLYARGAYQPRLHPRLLDELRRVIGASAIAAMAATTARVVLTDDTIPSTQAVRPWLFATTCLVAARAVLGWADMRARRSGEAARPTLILGAGRVGQLLAQRLLERPELGLKPIGFLDKEPLASVEGLPVLGASWDLDRIVGERGVENVIVTFSTAPHKVLLRLARRCEELGVEVSLVPRLFERVPERVMVDHIGGLPLVTPQPSNPRGWQFAIKYAFDRVAAAMLLLLFSPLLAVTALVVLV
jgi:FlaA1/EpsC-like NDP-sugar epimerase